MHKARKEAVDKCFEESDMGIYPNSEKIDNCVENARRKNLKTFDEHRILYFGNCNIFYCLFFIVFFLFYFY